MSYSTLALAARDSQLRDRIVACAATLGAPSPEQWAQTYSWQLVSSPGWDAAYAAALKTNKAPGDDGSVITDAMILAAVKPLLASTTPEGPLP